MDHILDTVLTQFCFDSRVVSCEQHGCGHINETYLTVCESGHKYILQKINHEVFTDVPALMDNVSAVIAYLCKKSSDPRAVMRLIPTIAKANYLHMPDGNYWRVYDYVENSICLQRPESPEDFYQSAVAFGNFQHQLADFPAATLNETIKNFHNTVERYHAFHEVLFEDVHNRCQFVRNEIEFALAHEEEADILLEMQREGKLPLRVTHNDTKLNNVMLDAKTRKALCVIDLDTVMPGLSLYDFGDSIRFGAATAAEDEKDLSKMEMSLELFAIYTRGFLKACPSLTEAERRMLPMGAKLMTLECGLRFLTDYLGGDHYFATHYEGQNLDRCRTQFKLVQDMEKKWERMNQIVQAGGMWESATK